MLKMIVNIWLLVDINNIYNVIKKISLTNGFLYRNFAL